MVRTLRRKVALVLFFIALLLREVTGSEPAGAKASRGEVAEEWLDFIEHEPPRLCRDSVKSQAVGLDFRVAGHRITDITLC
jgi:hypothetical protein